MRAFLFDIQDTENKDVKINAVWKYLGSNSTVDLIYANKVSPEFSNKVIEICKDLEINPNYLMACMAFETMETFDPCIKSGTSNARGLIQFMPATAISLGTTTDDLCKMSALEQLDYVKEYFLPYKGKVKNIEDVYMVIFCPKAVGQPMDSTLYPPTKKQYDANDWLDKDNDGKITKEEAYNAVKGKFEKGLK